MAEVHVFQVEMTCSGCSNAVNRVLGKLDGIDKVDIDLEKKTVRIEGSVPKDRLEEQLKKTGKEVTYMA
eukprot:Nk52_evm37s1992 gene=Nk52_evmTU37s1992